MEDADLAKEICALNTWRDRYVRPTGEGVGGGSGKPSGAAVAALMCRLSELNSVRTQREAHRAREAFKRREAQQKAEYEARARFGAPVRNADGTYTYPVSADDLGELGTVYRYFGGRTWTFTRADNGSSGPEFGTRQAAAGVLVWLGDLTAEAAERQRQQDQARATAPEGWESGNWDDLAEVDVIRIPRYGKAEDGGLYPKAWCDPMEVQRVSRDDNGTVVVSLTCPDGSYTDPLFVSSPAEKAVGFLWRIGRVRPRPQPHREKLRVRMADIGDDLATVSRCLASDRLEQRADLVARLERSRTQALFADLRLLEAETAWLMEQANDTTQPYEVREIKSWAVAAHRKTRWAREEFAADPDFAWAWPNAENSRPQQTG